MAHDRNRQPRRFPRPPSSGPAELPEAELGHAIAEKLLADKAIIGVFDEGCMGMYNAVIDDELLNPLGIYKERLSQSALYAELIKVTETEIKSVRSWLDDAGLQLRLGTDEVTELTDKQLNEQFAMYVAAGRLSDDFGLDAVGIQYQQGLKDLVAASDLVEGLLNNVERPPVTSRDGSRVLFDDTPVINFNEVDEGVAADALVTNRVWTAMGLDPATTLHDVRWGDTKPTCSTRSPMPRISWRASESPTSCSCGLLPHEHRGNQSVLAADRGG